MIDMSSNHLNAAGPSIPASPNQDTHVACYPGDYYQYEWFRLMVAIILVPSIEAALLLITSGTNFLNNPYFFAFDVAAIIGLPMLWAVTWLLLIEFHTPIGCFCSKRMRVPLNKQRGVLRFVAYVALLSFPLFLACTSLMVVVSA